MNQYDAVVSKAILVAFFRRLTLKEELATVRRGADGDVPKDLSRVPLSATQATWRNVWTLCAAGVLLCIALGVPPIGSAYVTARNLPLSHP